MKINISEEAAEWYKQELLLDDHANVRFFVRYGGIGGRIPGFSLGISANSRDLVHTSTTVNNITFYIAEEDAWYFENNDLNVTMDVQLEEPQFTYE